MPRTRTDIKNLESKFTRDSSSWSNRTIIREAKVIFDAARQELNRSDRVMRMQSVNFQRLAIEDKSLCAYLSDILGVSIEAARLMAKKHNPDGLPNKNKK